MEVPERLLECKKVCARGCERKCDPVQSILTNDPAPESIIEIEHDTFFHIYHWRSAIADAIDSLCVMETRKDFERFLLSHTSGFPFFLRRISIFCKERGSSE